MPRQKVSREFVIKEALKLFHKQGYHKTSMSDLGDSCGLQKGSVYHYFPSKEALAKEAINYLHEYYRDNAFIYAYDEKLGPEQRLRALARFSEDLFYSTESGCFMANIAMETGNVIPAFADMIKDFFQEWIDAMANIFKERYDEEEALQLAKESVYEIEGATMMMRIFDDKQYLKDAHKSIFYKWVGVKKDLTINTET